MARRCDGGSFFRRHSTKTSPASRRALATVALALFVLVGVVVVGGLSLPPVSWQAFGLTVADASSVIRRWGAWGIAASIGNMVAHSFLPFPAEVIAIANGVIYGPVWGTVITWTGAMLGAAAAFGVVRWLGRPILLRVASHKRVQQVNAWTQKHGVSALLVARLVPLIAFNLLNYAAALTQITWWTFLWTTGVGILPFTIVLSVFGAGVFALSRSDWILLGLVLALAWLGVCRAFLALNCLRTGPTPRLR